MMSSTLPSTNGCRDRETVNAFRSEITIGTSAPPHGQHEQHARCEPPQHEHGDRRDERAGCHDPRACHEATTITATMSTARPGGNTIALADRMPCSFENVMTEPAKLIAPMRSVSTIARRVHQSAA